MNEQQFWGIVADLVRAGYSEDLAIRRAKDELDYDYGDLFMAQHCYHKPKLPTLDYYDRLAR